METQPHTELRQKLVGLAERLDSWCNAETNITHRTARIGVGLMAMAGALAIAGWDNATWYEIATHKLNIVSAGERGQITNFGLPAYKSIRSSQRDD